jgi:hypothetical protein
MAYCLGAKLPASMEEPIIMLAHRDDPLLHAPELVVSSSGYVGKSTAPHVSYPYPL